MGKTNLVLAGSIGMTLLGGGLLTPSGALGQEAEPAESSHGLQEIVVTARRRDESIQKVPVAITSLSGDAIRQAAIQRVEDLRFLAPSLQISPSPFGNSVPGYTIRGQRQLESLATQDPSVVMYFAEVPMMRPHGTNGSFFDVQSVQVLKGPQGTLFGRNTTGGAVLLTPNRPDDVFGAELTAGVGNHGAYDTGGYLNLPVGDELAVRFAGQLQHRDGYTHDLHDDKDIDQDDIYAVRVGVLWEPADSIDSYTVYERSKRDQASSGWRLHAVNPAGAYSAFPGTVAALQDTLARLDASDWHTVDNDQVALEQAESWSLSNATSFEYRGLTFKNVLGYRSVETFGRFDYDGSAVTVTGSGTGTVSLFNSQNTLDGDQWSEEFQVLGSSFDDRLDWITGAFSFKEENYDDQRSELFGRRANVGTGTNESTSLFAQGTYHFAGIDGLSMTAGYRHTWDDRELISENQIQGLTQPALTCRLRNADGSILDPCRRLTTYQDDAPTYHVRPRIPGRRRHAHVLQLRSRLSLGRPAVARQQCDRGADVRSRNCRRLRNRPENYDGSWLHDAAHQCRCVLLGLSGHPAHDLLHPDRPDDPEHGRAQCRGGHDQGRRARTDVPTNRQSRDFRIRSRRVTASKSPQARARSRHISAMRARSMTRWPMSSARTPFAASAPDSYRRFMPSAITAMRQ